MFAAAGLVERPTWDYAHAHFTGPDELERSKSRLLLRDTPGFAANLQRKVTHALERLGVPADWAWCPMVSRSVSRPVPSRRWRQVPPPCPAHPQPRRTRRSAHHRSRGRARSRPSRCRAMALHVPGRGRRPQDCRETEDVQASARRHAGDRTDRRADPAPDPLGGTAPADGAARPADVEDRPRGGTKETTTMTEIQSVKARHRLQSPPTTSPAR